MADAVFGATGDIFGTQIGWDLQSATYTDQSERAAAFGATGNETNSEVYDQRRNWTCNYKANVNYTATAPTIPASIGAQTVVSGEEKVTLTSIVINTVYNDFATMVLSGHQHVDGTDGSAALRSVAHGITISKGFGAQAFGTTGGESVESGSCTITCEHAEAKDENGDTCAGENHNPRIQLNVTWLGQGATAPANYDTTSVDNPTDNNGFSHSTIQCEKPLAFT